MLQETHVKTDSENYLRSLWGYNCFTCGNSNASKGVAILFKNTFEYKVNNVIKDDINSSFLFLDIDIFNERFTLASIYGPSDRDDAEFFDNIFQIVERIGNRQVVMSGDWNILLNPNLDSRNYRSLRSKPRSRKIIQDKMEQLDLVDIYRSVYPNKRAYTWRRFNTIQQGRLDFILLSDSLVDKVINVDINSGYRSDHSIVSATINFLQLQNNSKSYWKFNNSLLKDMNYILEIKKVISNTKIQYALPIYNFDNIDNIPNDSIQYTINDQLFFETLLLEIRGKTISYSTYIKRKNEKEEHRLVQEIEILESDPNIDNEKMLILEQNKLKLQEYREIKLRGMIVRSRINWLDQGEKPSKYFCQLENRNYKAKRMCFLEQENGNIVYEQDELIEETKNFYKKLYEKRQVEVIDLNNLVNNQPKLSNTERDSIEGQINYQEAAESLKNMKNNKSSGNSGFTTEFYKFFFVDIGHFLVRAINFGFESNILSVTQRQGVITCLPKEGKNLQQLNNWRPISLLNVSYKIASTCISNRIKKYLQNLIHEYQSGFQSNKFIGSNLNLLFNILSYTDYENIPGMLVLVDFYKAFDSIDWDFIEQVLDFLNFGVDMKHWVKIFYTDITSCVMVNGHYSEYFSIGRGVRQGDPLSPYLFLLCAEILAQTIRECDRIKGIQIDRSEALLSQFADDTALYLDGSKESFENCIRILTRFASISGLTINFQKTIIVWLGSKKNCNERFLRDMNFTWDPGGAENSKIKYLGVFFSTNIQNIIKFNYDDKLEQVNKILKTWSKRFLTPFGKITVIKTLALSKLTYLFTNIPDPEPKFIKELESILFKFLWNGKTNKISKEHVFKDKLSGGLNMVNVYDYISCLKIGMYKRVFGNEEQKMFILAMYPPLKNIEALGYEFINIVSKRIPNILISDMLKHVRRLLIKSVPQNFCELANEHIFYNANICINQQVVFFRSWVDNDIVKICHIINGRGNILTFDEFQTKFPMIRINFLDYNGLVSSIRSYMRKLNMNCENVEDVGESVGWQILKSGKKIIEMEIDNKPGLHKSCIKWNNSFPSLDWPKIYFKCHKTTIDTKLKWFQLRLLYRILPTNRFLHIRRIIDNENCEKCRSNVETLEHMFFDCPFVSLFWDNLKQKFISKLPHANTLQLSKELIIFGIKDNVVTDKPFDLFLLLGKYYIYTCKFSNAIPNADIYIEMFKQRYRLEKSCNSTNKNNFNRDWMPYQQLVT